MNRKWLGVVDTHTSLSGLPFSLSDVSDVIINKALNIITFPSPLCQPVFVDAPGVGFVVLFLSAVVVQDFTYVNILHKPMKRNNVNKKKKTCQC